MELTAFAVAVLFTFVHSTTYRYQQFTRKIARGKAAKSQEIPEIQKRLTPSWIVYLVYLGYALAAVSAYLGYQVYGWYWVSGLGLWWILTAALSGVVWPFPSQAQSVRMALGEVRARRAAADARGAGRRDSLSDDLYAQLQELAKS